MSKKKGWLLLGLLALCAAAFAGYIYMGRQQDNSAPEISFQSEELQVSVTADDAALLEGVTAGDEQDGDVTSSIVVERVSNISSDQQATVTYAAFDQAGNVAKAQRTLRYTDYQSPRFSLSQPLVFSSNRTADVMNFISATDAIDGSLDDRIKASLVGGEGDLTDVGTHEVEFRVTNSMGETIYLTTPVEIYPDGLYNASIQLTQNIVYLQQGAAFTPESYLVEMTSGSQTITINNTWGVTVQTSSDVNTQVPGCYSVAYTVTSGTMTGHTRLAVVVEE